MGVLIITHYQRILHIVKPQFVHIMFEGRIVKEGGPELVTVLEEKGYGWIRDEVAAAALMSLAVPTSAEFPTLAREGLVYLDTAATSQTVRPAIEAMDRYYETYRASIHRGIYAIASEATDAYEARAREGRRVHELDARRDDLHQERDRGDQPRRLLVGPRERRRRTTSWCITQMEHHSNIVPWQLLGCRLAYVPVTDDGPARPRRARRAARAGPEARRRRARLQRARDDQPDRRDRRARARRRRARAGRRRAGRAVAAGRRRRARRRLLRLDRPQGLRADRHRRPARPPRAAGGDAAVPRRRAHDRPRRRLRVHLGRAAARKFEAGTMPIAEAIGLGAAVDWLAAIGMDAVREHGRDVTALRARAARPRSPGLTIHGTADARRARLARQLRARGHPPARRGRDPRPRGRVRARRPPLRAAADAPPRLAGLDARVVRDPHHARGRRPR